MRLNSDRAAGPDEAGLKQAVILAGGRGSRLGGLVDHCPKPMLEVGGAPFLEHLIRFYADQGFGRPLILAGYQAETLTAYFQDPRREGRAMDIVTEPEPLGTAGALRHAAGRLDERFLLANGDSICLTATAGLSRPFERPESLGRILLLARPDNPRYGRVTVAGGLVESFEPRRPEGGPGLINSGLYWFQRTLLDFPAPGPSLEADLLPALAAAGRLEYDLAPPEAFFIDIGLPEDLRRARAELPALIAGGGNKP